MPVKEFAITHFGTHDKLALVTGILVLVAGFAAVIGLLAVRRLALGLAGLGTGTPPPACTGCGCGPPTRPARPRRRGARAPFLTARAAGIPRW